MGRLVDRTQLDLYENWYFTDSYYSRDGGKDRYVYKWPSPDFPYYHHIHLDHLDNEKRIKIRRWIENNISDLVIYDHLDLGYRRHYGESRDWDSGYDVNNRWLRFFFEDENSSLMFKVAFSDLIKTPEKHHPDRPEDEEWCKKPIGER
jgi:hypothetical protein